MNTDVAILMLLADLRAEKQTLTEQGQQLQQALAESQAENDGLRNKLEELTSKKGGS